MVFEFYTYFNKKGFNMKKYATACVVFVVLALIVVCFLFFFGAFEGYPPAFSQTVKVLDQNEKETALGEIFDNYYTERRFKSFYLFKEIILPATKIRNFENAKAHLKYKLDNPKLMPETITCGNNLFSENQESYVEYLGKEKATKIYNDVVAQQGFKDITNKKVVITEGTTLLTAIFAIFLVLNFYLAFRLSFYIFIFLAFKFVGGFSWRECLNPYLYE